MRYLAWMLIGAALFSLWLYECNRTARAMPIDIWVLLSEHLFVPEDMFNKSECEKLRKKILKQDKNAICVPMQVDREIS